MKTDSKNFHIIFQDNHKQPNKETRKLINTHSEYGKWLLYQDKNENFCARETHEDKEWIVNKRTKKEHN